MKPSENEKTIATNRSAFRDYEVIEKIEAGLQLRGGEVKSLRQARANLKGSFARIEKEEIFLYNLHITPYEYATDMEVNPIRVRKLLLHKSQIKRLIGKVMQKGFTLVPLRLYFKKGIIKTELALVKGKKLYDKRYDLKKRETDLEIKRKFKYQ